MGPLSVTVSRRSRGLRARHGDRHAGGPPGGEPYTVPLTAAHASVMADSAPDALELLIAREDGAPDDEPGGLPPGRARAMLSRYLELIPALEADAIELYFLRGLPQPSVAEILGMTQQAVSYRILRGIQRVRWHHQYGGLFRAEELIAEAPRLRRHGVSPARVQMLATLWTTGLFSEVARRHRVSADQARDACLGALKAMRRLVEQGHGRYRRYVTGLDAQRTYGLGLMMSQPPAGTRGAEDAQDDEGEPARASL